MSRRPPTFSLKPHQSALVAAIIAAAVIELVPWVQALLRPLVYLNTHIHELCHAIVTIFTGGHVQEILVRGDGSGVTPVLGGNIYLIASAGYLGATMVGAAMIRFGSTSNRARGALGALAIAIAFSMIIFVRGDFIGVVSGFVWIALLGFAALGLRGNVALFACQFIGLQQCLNSLVSVYQLLQISVIGERQSDAGIMQQNTLIPAAFWAILWCLFSIGMIYLTARSVWRSNPIAG